MHMHMHMPRMEWHEADEDSWSEVHASHVGSHVGLLAARARAQDDEDEVGTVLLSD